MIVSIIIAVKTWQKNLENCVDKCKRLDFSDFEILILPDLPLDKELSDTQMKVLSSNAGRFLGRESIRIINSGEVDPAKKRDIALKHAKGEILAFIDDDAYPREDWLKNAVNNFNDETVAAVGGPAITPLEDNLLQKASGIVYSSILVSGNYKYRYLPAKKRMVVDYPSCNFLVRKSIMQELGGFKTKFWPGEDTKLCLDITQKLGKKIIYDPSVLVYHHRRPLFKAHLKQIASYALHRGYFVKKYPQTSLKISYFIPTLFLFFLIAGAILALFSREIKIIYLYGVSLYLILSLIFSISNDLRLPFLVFPGIIFTHLTYGLYFLKGIISKRLREEL